MILELLHVPPGVRTREGAPVVPYQRLPLPDGGLVIGGPGSDLVVPEVRDAACRISSADGKLRIAHLRRALSQVTTSGMAQLIIDSSPVSLRVVSGPEPSPAWPQVAASRAVESAPPGVASLEVLADALLEVDHPLGERLRAGSARPDDDAYWLAHFHALLTSGELQLTWHRTVAQQAVIRGGSSALSSFAGHALLHLVQRLDLIPWAESGPLGPERMLELLSEGTLPWLEDLRIHNLSARELRTVEREFKSRASWRRAFPRVRGPTLLRRERLGVETAGKVEEVGESGVHLDAVLDTSTIPVVRHWVREFQGAVMLGTSSSELVFNGRALQRPAGGLATWTIHLVAGDEFFLEGKARRIVSLGPLS